ncbi:hypothetical protein SAMN04489835_4232 [Mycolicibacterium rutilum]|uniref:Uncharacterized protein n=2 Tax=Mycolicibacterium rutilum TaxID=370526 RepID=A0A1H6KVE8_MYCRU|nr:hypothetical protein SAMN04489835_4232 [Mycolicibacterium rutilum]
MVLPADVGRVGVLGAAILALVRYVNGLPGETNGRKTVDGEMWWRASQDDIGQALGGVHRDSIRRALVKLQGAGELLARTPVDSFYGDRAQAYRVPDVPLRGMQQGSDVPLRENAESIARNAASRCGETQQAGAAKHNILPISGELSEEVGEKAEPAADEPLDVEPVPDPDDDPPPRNLPAQSTDPAGAWVDAELVDDDPDPDPGPQRYCDAHMPEGTDASCGACGRRRKIRDEWQQRQQARFLMTAFSKTAEPTTPVRREPLPKPEPPAWVPGPDGRPRCRRHGHLPTAPPACTRCHDAAIAAGTSA